jgi:arylformamidase
MRSIAFPTQVEPLRQAWQQDADWLTAQYNNRALVPDHMDHLTRWAQSSERVRAAQPCQLNVPYGPGPLQTLDVFHAKSPADGGLAPVLVFIHGGWWRALDKSDHSFVAPAFTPAGVPVVVPNYSLAPKVSVETIALGVTRAIAWVWQHAASFGGDATRIVVAGHSAGGHLAAMMLACDWSLVDAAMPRHLLTSALSLSGLFDLEPVRHAPFVQTDLRLTQASAARLSPANFPPPAGQLRVLVGEAESSEFHRQSRLIEAAWGPARVPLCASIAGCHHFSILEELARVGSRTHRVALNALQP